MKSSIFNSHYSLLGDLLALLTDYHANGAYEKLKENVTLLDKENYAVMIRTTNFESKNFSENFIYVDKHAYEYLKKSKVYPDDLIMNKIANPGTVYFMPNIGKPVSLGMNLFLLRIDKSKADPYFVYSFLRQNEDYVKSFASGSTTKTITKDDVRKLRVYSPPLPEQIKIAEILSTWDNAINTVQKLLANSQQQKKSLMQQLLTGKKRFAGFEGEWEEKRLGDIGCTFTGLSGKTKEDFGVGSPYITYMNIFSNPKINISIFDRVNILENENQSQVKFGDIFFTTSSETPKEVGMSSVLLEEVETVYLNSFCFGFRLHSFSILSPYFARFLFRGAHIRRVISKLAQGATRYNLSKTQLLNMVFKIPSTIEEQQKIAAVLTIADQEIENLRAQLNHFKREKKALMQQLLTGKRRVKVEEAA